MLAKVYYNDPMSPMLLSSPPLVVSDEQKMYIEKSIRLATSDSQFAKKLYDSIIHILTDGNTVLPVVTSITPSSAVLGSPSFDVHVMGSGFTPTTKIVFNGFEEPTTFVSDKELTTGVNMDVWLAPAIVPVGVVNGNGIPSETKMFTFSAAGTQSATIHQTPQLKK